MIALGRLKDVVNQPLSKSTSPGLHHFMAKQGMKEYIYIYIYIYIYKGALKNVDLFRMH